MFVQIKKVMPLVAREYTDRLNNRLVFKSKGFMLESTDGTIYAEALQELAEKLDSMRWEENDGWCDVSLVWTCREYTNAQGVEKYANEVVIRKILL